MPSPLAIDAHAHILSEDTIALLAKETPRVEPRLIAIDKNNYTLVIAGTPYRPFPRGGFDLEQRFADMAASEVDMQVLSNTPQTFLYGEDEGLTAATSIIQNDQIAKLVDEHPDRFYGLATLPMQAPKGAAAELERAINKLGLQGAQIGSNINGRNLDEPEFEPVWAVADRYAALIMVHPNNVAGADWLKRYYLNNLIGNPLDTTIAAASLVFGGVIERFPNIRFFLVHGGGFVPYQAGRWQHGWEVRPEPQVRLKEPPAESLRTLYYDTILHGQPPLAFLAEQCGDRLLLGSDYPYDMGTFECARQVKALPISDEIKSEILGGLAQRLFGSAPRD